MRQGVLRVLGVGVVLTCARVCMEFTISDLVLSTACACVVCAILPLLISYHTLCSALLIGSWIGVYALLYGRIFVYRTQSTWIDFIGVIVVLLNFVTVHVCVSLLLKF